MIVITKLVERKIYDCSDSGKTYGISDSAVIMRLGSGLSSAASTGYRQ